MTKAQIQTINTRENKQKGKGHAIISITGLNLVPSSLGFYIKRNGVDKPYLGQGGWQVADAMLKPDAVTEIEAGLEIHLGPNVVAYMENSNFILGLSYEGSSEIIEASMFWENVRPIQPVIKPGRAGGPFGGPRSTKKTVKPESVKPAPAPPPVASPPTEPPTEPPPPPTPESPKKSKKGLIISLIILLILVAIGGWYFIEQSNKPENEQDPVIIDSGNESDSDKKEPNKTPVLQSPRERYEKAKNSNLSPEQLYQEGLKFLKEAKTSNNKDLIAYAESLFREAGDGDYALGYLAIGKIYDPKDFTSDRATQLKVTAEKAYHYYNLARETGSVEAEENIKRVRKWVEQQAQQGDPAAQKLLRVWLGQF